MEKRYLIRRASVMVMSFVVLFLLSSCHGTQPQVTPSSMPTMSDGTETNTVNITVLPSPSPSQVPIPTPSPSEKVSTIPEEWKDNGIFSDYYEKAYATLGKMTLEEKVGQMILARCPQEDAEGIIRKYQPGGFVLFGVNFKGKTTEAVISMLEAYQHTAQIPMIMAVDEEGGSVVRVSGNINLSKNRFHSPQWLFNSGGLHAVREDTLNKSVLLKKLGINLNLAPVADVSTDPTDYIYPRAYGQPATETGEYVATVVAAMHKSNLSGTLKHFPGYGNNVDTHLGIAVDNRPYSLFKDSDFIPFEKGIAAGAESILVSHNIVNCMDKGVPASLSPAVHNILRNTLKFTGIIMTDDLSMDAIKVYAGNTDPAVLAVLAGNDLLVLSDYENAFISILASVNSGALSIETIDHAVFRILAWKSASGIINAF